MSANDFEERVVTVPLRDVRAEPVQKRADRAMSLIRAHLSKHFKVDDEDVRLDPSLNEAIWEKGRSNPPSSIGSWPWPVSNRGACSCSPTPTPTPSPPGTAGTCSCSSPP